MQSMTGFGKGEVSNLDQGMVSCVEISSVNRKQLDMRVNLPREFFALEPVVRRLVGEKIKRGMVTIRVSYEPLADTHIDKTSVNTELLLKLAKECNTIQDKFTRASWSISELLLAPGVLHSPENNLMLEMAQCGIEKAVKLAIDELRLMRQAEGNALALDIKSRLDNLQTIVNKLELLVAEIPQKLHEKIIGKLADCGLDIDMDDERLLKEVVIYADKTDTTEEIIRLKSHFEQFKLFLAEKNEPIGRKMDFLTQEIFREINTLGTKAGNSQITPLVVDFKTELEKIKEQVQNIE